MEVVIIHCYRNRQDSKWNPVSFTSTFGGNNQGFLFFTPAHNGASGESKHVALLRGKSCDGELATVGAHLHCGPAQRVPAVQAVGDLVA